VFWSDAIARRTTATPALALHLGERYVSAFAAQRQAGLAQLVEHLICNQGVGGSSPSAGTNKINRLGDLAIEAFDL
jgi:hypothetical protein